MKKVGLTLSGGGALGLAHIGVIKTLVENNIPIDYISGTSIGAFVGGIYAATKSTSVLEEIALNNDWKKIFNLFFDPSFKGGLITGNKIIKLIEKYVGNAEFSDLKIPFVAVATDFNTGQAVQIKSGKLSKAIRASIAVPFLFQAVTIDRQILFDGGLSSPYPVEAVKKMGAEVVVGVNLYDDYLLKFPSQEIGNIPTICQSIKIFLRNLSLVEAQKADVNIVPESTKIGWNKIINQKGSQQGIDLGIAATNIRLKEIKKIVFKEKRRLLKRLFNFLSR